MIMSRIFNGNMGTFTETIIKYGNNNAKSSNTFSNYIRNVPIEEDEIMVSFDVTSL